MADQNESPPHQPALDPIRVAQVILGALALVGAGVERTLHYLHASEQYPEFQLLVIQVVATTLCLFMVVIAIFAAAILASELGKADRQVQGLWKKYSIRVLTVVIVGFFILLSWFFIDLGNVIFGDGMATFIESVRAEI